MMQTVIKVGNSLAVTIPKEIIDNFNWKQGQKIFVDHDEVRKTIIVGAKPMDNDGLNKDYFSWKQKFIKNNTNLLLKLAKSPNK
jgi:bifunctional DNA-binding transcriptional regulator/antitoxin component of YhaV-PrlF toxin-antitoxin module